MDKVVVMKESIFLVTHNGIVINVIEELNPKGESLKAFSNVTNFINRDENSPIAFEPVLSLGQQRRAALGNRSTHLNLLMKNHKQADNFLIITTWLDQRFIPSLKENPIP
jgi:hypothetical protein